MCVKILNYNFTYPNANITFQNMNLSHLMLGLVAAAGLSACSSTKTVLPYFSDISDVETGSFETGDYSAKIKPDDELLITVTSLQPGATAIYNLPLSNPARSSELFKVMTPAQQTFIVDSKGDINFPVLGSVKVEGLTVEEVQQHLTELISKDVENPIVNVSLLNFRVVVAGEVQAPRSINVTRNRYSILDALADAGDLTEYGERSNVLLIREENGERKFVHLDLNSSDVLTSPYFFLRQNDYIYVEPNKIRQANSKYNQNNAFKLTVVSTIVSAASVIASLVIALTVK